MAVSKTIKAEQFNDAIAQILNEYADDVLTASQLIVKEAGEQAKNEVATNAKTSGIGGKKYVKSFTVKYEKTRLGATATVHSSMYQLTHLLEHGHVIKTKSGEMKGVSKAFPHWSPAEALAERNLVASFEKVGEQ